MLEQKLDRAGLDLSKSLEAIQKRDAGTFSATNYPRSADILSTLIELARIHARIAEIDDQID